MESLSGDGNSCSCGSTVRSFLPTPVAFRSDFREIHHNMLWDGVPFPRFRGRGRILFSCPFFCQRQVCCLCDSGILLALRFLRGQCPTSRMDYFCRMASVGDAFIHPVGGISWNTSDAFVSSVFLFDDYRGVPRIRFRHGISAVCHFSVPDTPPMATFL